MTPTSPAQAGWYPDPEEPSLQRLFDGVKWTSSVRKPPGRFAAKYAHKAAGIWLLVIGILFALFVPGAISGVVQAASSSGVGSAVVGLIIILVIVAGLIGWSVFLLRGRGENPAAASKRAQEQLALERQFQWCVERLSGQTSRAATFVAVRNVEQAAARAFGQAGTARAAAAIASRGIGRSAVASPRLGSLALAGSSGWFEVFRDWVVCGQEAHDVDEHTRMSVYLDGSIQMVPKQVTRNGKVETVTSAVDMRQASVHVVSDTWKMSARINPDVVNEARGVAEQLAAQVARLKPRAVSAADIQSMVDAILARSTQPVAERLQQLSNLRYERILSDAEFAQAKDKLLANPGA